MNKKIFVILALLSILAISVFARNEWNYLTLAKAKELFCMIGGTCEVTNLNVTNNIYENNESLSAKYEPKGVAGELRIDTLNGEVRIKVS